MFDVATTDFLSLSDFLRAIPAEEGGRRFVYVEASNEARDYEGDKVLSKALGDSADYYLRYGNLDLDHITQLGPRRGIENYHAFEIGRPVTVKVDGPTTHVKGEIFTGQADVAANANMFWDSITKINPVQRWYPSIGGKLLDKETTLDPVTRTPKTTVNAIRWTNIGFSKTPVNLDVPHASTVPYGVLAKSWGPHGLDLNKALEAGYGTDSATLTGGGALRGQSLDTHLQSYWGFRERMAGDIRAKHVRANPTGMIAHAVANYGVDHAEAADWTERFLADLARGRATKTQKD